MLGRCSSLFLALPLHGAWADYMDLGPGKCLTGNGTNPLHSFYSNKGHNCEQLCDENERCHGFSTSEFGHCLLWEEPELKAGGAPWGHAHCFVQHPFHQSAREDCRCTGGRCSWELDPECVNHMIYKGKPYVGCTTVAYGNKGWCSPHATYDAEDWRMCVLSCPEGCYWKHPARCVPRPEVEASCWKPAPECVPQFWYKGTLYSGCATVGDSQPWCAHTSSFAASGKSSYCTACCDEGGTAVMRASVVSVLVGALCAGVLGQLYLKYGASSSRTISNWNNNIATVGE